MSAAPRLQAGRRTDDPPAPRGPERRRQRVLDAAAACFARSGFARTRIEDVAGAAGVSRALVYHHFASKEGLARAVQDHMFEAWSTAVDEALAGAGSACEALAAWLQVNSSDARRPLLHAMLADDAAPVLPDLEVAAERAMEEWRAKLVALLEQGVASGELRDDLDVPATAEVLRAMQVGLLQHLVDDKPYLDVSGEHHLRAATGLLLAGLRAPAACGDAP